MFVLYTYTSQKIGDQVYRTLSTSVQYFENDELEKAKRLCDNANKFWEKTCNDELAHVYCTLKYVEEKD